MKTILIISLLGMIISLSNFPIPTLYYNTEYVLDNTEISYAQYYFRAVVDNCRLMDFTLTVNSSEFNKNYFQVKVLGFSSSPTDSEIYNYNWDSIYALSGRYSNKGEYTVIAFRYDITTYYNYLAIMVSYTTTKPSYSYISFKVDVSKYYYSDIIDLNYTTDYQFDVSIWSPPKVPYGYQIYIRIAVKPEDKMEIQLTTQSAYDKNTAFKVDVCQFKDKPTESQVYYGSDAKVCKNGLNNNSTEDKKYIYPYTTESDVNYLAISIINQINDLSYIFIRINKTNDPVIPDDGGNGKSSSEINRLSNYLMALLILIIL